MLLVGDVLGGGQAAKRRPGRPVHGGEFCVQSAEAPVKHVLHVEGPYVVAYQNVRVLFGDANPLTRDSSSGNTLSSYPSSSSSSSRPSETSNSVNRIFFLDEGSPETWNTADVMNISSHATVALGKTLSPREEYTSRSKERILQRAMRPGGSSSFRKLAGQPTYSMHFLSSVMRAERSTAVTLVIIHTVGDTPVAEKNLVSTGISVSYTGNVNLPHGSSIPLFRYLAQALELDLKLDLEKNWRTKNVLKPLHEQSYSNFYLAS